MIEVAYVMGLWKNLTTSGGMKPSSFLSIHMFND